MSLGAFANCIRTPFKAVRGIPVEKISQHGPLFHSFIAKWTQVLLFVTLFHIASKTKFQKLTIYCAHCSFSLQSIAQSASHGKFNSMSLWRMNASSSVLLDHAYNALFERIKVSNHSHAQQDIVVQWKMDKMANISSGAVIT